MVIRSLELHQFRNYRQLQVEFGPCLNWLHGHNGQGKTNLVEAIAYLCNLESFRTRKTQQLWYSEANAARMTALLEQQQVLRRVQIILSTRGRQVWLDHAPFQRTSEYVLSFLALSFTPEDVALFRGPPQERRRFFNRIISTLDPGYFRHLQDYTKVLAEKNAALRLRQDRQLSAWNQVLARTGWELIQRRAAFAEQLLSHLVELFRMATGRPEQLSLRYHPAVRCSDSEQLEKMMEEQRDRELQSGYALIGPHRDDYHLFLDEKIDRDFFSQGELRVTNLSLKIAINQLLFSHYSLHPILIFDDLFSELDAQVSQRLLGLFAQLQNQIFVTSTTRPEKLDTKSCSFQVVQGQFV
jgi:DNA replication and repair protein RecF